MIEIPFFEKRISVSSVDQILYRYFPEKLKSEIMKNQKIEDLTEMTELYLKTLNITDPDFYLIFYKSLADSDQINVFCHYDMRMTGSPYIKEWYKVNGKPLNAFAVFLDKNLPEK
jgi:hypothetical protein